MKKLFLSGDLCHFRDQIRRAEDRVEKAESMHGQCKLDTMVSVGTTLIGAMLGRRSTASAGRSLRSGGRLGKSRDDIDRAEDELTARQEQLRTLEAEFQAEADRFLSLPPRKGDMRFDLFGLAWGR